MPLASLEANGLACEYEKQKASNPNFQVGTISGRNWIGRVAARKAIAAAQGLKNDEPTRFELGIYEDFLAAARRSATRRRDRTRSPPRS